MGVQWHWEIGWRLWQTRPEGHMRAAMVIRSPSVMRVSSLIIVSIGEDVVQSRTVTFSRHGWHAHLASSHLLASCRSGVSNPSVNQL